MFSSLPSAGKIYVSSTKTKQKNVSSAKKKRKKSDAGSKVVESNVDDTLISLTPKTETVYDDLSFKDEISQSIVKKDKSALNISNIHNATEKRNDAANTNYDPCDSDDLGVPATNDYLEIAIESGNSDDDFDNSNFGFVKTPIKLTDNNINGLENFKDRIRKVSQYEVSRHEVISDEETKSDSELESSADKFVRMKSNSRSSSVTSATSVRCGSQYHKINDDETILDKQGTISDSICAQQTVNSVTVENNAAVKCNSLSEDFTVNNESFEVDKTASEDCCLLIDESTSKFCEKSLNVSVEENKFTKLSDSKNDSSNCIYESTNFTSHDKTGSENTEFLDEVNLKLKALGEKNFFDEKDYTLVPDTNICEDQNDFVKYKNDNEVPSSLDHSEQNSCTESVIDDVRNSANTSNSENAFTYQYKKIMASKNNIVNTSPLKFDSKGFQSTEDEHIKPSTSLYIKRSLSLPSLILKNEKKYPDISSSETPSSNADPINFYGKKLKAYEEKSVQYSDNLKKVESNSVAIGSDLPMSNKMPVLTMLKARMRNYVFGCKGIEGALLGSEELSRFFPQNKVTIFVGTWNMNGHDAPENIDDFILPLATDTIPDIYAIGVQESMQSKSEWELLLQTTLGPSHVLFTSSSLGVLHLAIFLRRDLIWFCSEPEEANVATRVGSMVKTKGAVAICFLLFGTSFLFVNSHLTAHEQNLVDRISDYEKICSSLDLPRSIPLKSGQCSSNVTSRFDNVFWCGDLNFRITCTRPDVLRFVKENCQTSSQSNNLLMDHDQLQKAIKEGAAFHGFQEGLINFNPSFKFDVGTNTFDSTKHRTPSYTDRILYRSKDSSSILCLHYNSVPEVMTSDHKPVYAIFDVSLKPGRDNVPLAAGIFKRDVYLEALRKRANFLEVNRNRKQSAICNVM